VYIYFNTNDCCAE